MKMNSCSCKRWKLGDSYTLRKHDGTMHEINVDTIEVYLFTNNCYKITAIFSIEFKNEKSIKSDIN